MKNRILMGVTLALSLFAARVAVAQETPLKLSDAEISKILVGKWTEELKSLQMKATATSVFKADGSLISEAVIVQQRTTTSYAVIATWKVEDGFLIETIQDGDSDALPKGKATKSKILSVSANEITLKSEDGQTVVMTRVKD